MHFHISVWLCLIIWRCLSIGWQYKFKLNISCSMISNCSGSGEILLGEVENFVKKAFVNLKEDLAGDAFLSPRWKRWSESSSRTITSSLFPGTRTWLLPAWRRNVQRVAASSTTRRRPSSPEGVNVIQFIVEHWPGNADQTPSLQTYSIILQSTPKIQ